MWKPWPRPSQARAEPSLTALLAWRWRKPKPPQAKPKPWRRAGTSLGAMSHRHAIFGSAWPARGRPGSPWGRTNRPRPAGWGHIIGPGAWAGPRAGRAGRWQHYLAHQVTGDVMAVCALSESGVG